MCSTLSCVSCDVHYNASLLAPLLPLLDTQQVVTFLVKLVNLLQPDNIQHIYSILKVTSARYTPVHSTGDVKRGLLAGHRLHMVLQWYSAKASYPLRVTFLMKVLCFIPHEVMTHLTSYLAMCSEAVPQGPTCSEASYRPTCSEAGYSPWSGQCFSERRGSVDFISLLPVTVSKLILSYVNLVWSCRGVNKRWYIIVKELLAEQRQFRSHVFRCKALQPATRNVNPANANKTALCFPKGICNTGHPYTSEEGDHVKVILEERNVYCSPFHIINLTRHTDPHRTLHYSRGRFIAVGSKDRKVRMKWAGTGKAHRTITGHAGSVRSCLLLEDKKIVLSGSYDTTVRAWSLETGACLRIWKGHRGTITCLDAAEKVFVSGSKDRQVKVWYLERSQLKRTLSHPRPVIAVKLLGQRAVVGTESHKVFVWDVLQGVLLQSLPTDGAVHCVHLTPHYVLGGGGSVLYVWNMISLHLCPMFLLPHPDTVLAVQYCYLRAVTGCSDGKVRVWSLVSGQCIKVIRGNALSDPITQLYLDDNRLFLNTLSSVMCLTFSPVQWDYCSEPYLLLTKVEPPVERKECKKKVPRARSNMQSYVRQHSQQSYVRQHSQLSSEVPSPYREVTSSEVPSPYREVTSSEVPSPYREVTSSEVPSPYRKVTIEGWTPHNTAHAAQEQCQEVTIESIEEKMVPVEESVKCEGCPSSVYKVAAELQLFEDNFDRTSRIMTPPEDRFTKVCQVQRGVSNRPQSAPFPSRVLSLHGTLPSFTRRRPKTAATLRHHTNQVVEKDCWQSPWQNLLEDNTQLFNLTDGDMMATMGDVVTTATKTVVPSPLHGRFARAQSAVDGRTVSNCSNTRSKVRPATARIRY